MIEMCSLNFKALEGPWMEGFKRYFPGHFVDNLDDSDIFNTAISWQKMWREDVVPVVPGPRIAKGECLKRTLNIELNREWREVSWHIWVSFDFSARVRLVMWPHQEMFVKDARWTWAMPGANSAGGEDNKKERTAVQRSSENGNRRILNKIDRKLSFKWRSSWRF